MGAFKEREAVKKIGKRPDWPSKVDHMTDQKVIAIYLPTP
jgi:hypothetical protein